MIWILILLIGYIKFAFTTPPACFLSCVSEVTRFSCNYGLIDLTCACGNENEVTNCLVDICPYGAFLSARDHFIGTCLEHGRPSITNPFPPSPIWPPTNEEEEEEAVRRKASRIATRTNLPSRTRNTNGAISRPSTRIKTRPTTSRTRRRVQPIPIPTPPPPPPPQAPPRRYPSPPSDSDDEEYDANAYCEWEDTTALDEYGNFIIIRRPINVPKQFRDPRNVGYSRRVFIKHGTDYYSSRQNKRLRVNIVNAQDVERKPFKKPDKFRKYTINTPEGQYRVSRMRPEIYR